jgi:hypothetical protein
MKKFNQNLFPMDEIRADTTYFAITLGADEDGKWWTETAVQWAGYADEARRIENRTIRPVVPEKMADLWKDLKEPFCVVNDDRGWVRWMLGGGHALITEEQTRKNLPWEMEVRPMVWEPSLGWKDASNLPNTAFQRAPTPKLRMRVLKRDKYGCMICGRRRADYEDVELHVHHIRPVSKQGLTVEWNLISLCHTCHAGLEPHYEYTLFDLIGEDTGRMMGKGKRERLQEYITSVQNLRNSHKKNPGQAVKLSS